MKKFKNLPLLASVVAMVLISVSTETGWLRAAAIIIAIAALLLFAKSNYRNSDS